MYGMDYGCMDMGKLTGVWRNGDAGRGMEGKRKRVVFTY